jgi:hypothetical protein
MMVQKGRLRIQTEIVVVYLALALWAIEFIMLG